MLGGGGIPLAPVPRVPGGAGRGRAGRGDLLFFYTDGLTETRSPDMGYSRNGCRTELVKLAGRSAAKVVAGVQARAEAF